MTDPTEGWSTLLDPLSDSTRDDFEREFPEIPTLDLCASAIMFRLARLERRMSVAEIKAEISALEADLNSLLERLDRLSDEADDLIAVAARGGAAGCRGDLIARLRSYRSVLWSVDNQLEPVRGAGKGALPKLVASMARIFEAHEVPVDAKEGGRFMKAIRIAMIGAGDPRESAPQLKSLANSVHRALTLREQNKSHASA